MLKGIPSIISPYLMKTMMEMGHEDEIVLADGNFPASSCAKRLIRCDGHSITDILDALLKFLPLDYAVQYPAIVMAVPQGNPYQPVVRDGYLSIISKYEASVKEFELLDRFSFYERAKKAYAIVATGESARFANIILVKGFVR